MKVEENQGVCNEARLNEDHARPASISVHCSRKERTQRVGADASFELREARASYNWRKK